MFLKFHFLQPECHVPTEKILIKERAYKFKDCSQDQSGLPRGYPVSPVAHFVAALSLVPSY